MENTSPIDELVNAISHLVNDYRKANLKDDEIYIYDEHLYRVVIESKIKVRGVIRFLTSLGVTFVIPNQNLRTTYKWLEVVIYECLYDNPDGQYWVREKNDFYDNFKIKEDDSTDQPVHL